jgi:hypothetical protein
MSKLEFHVHHTQIIVSMPYTCFRMTYQASLEAPRLVELPFWTRDDRTAPISLTEFRWRAWQAALEKARELGWIAWGMPASLPLPASIPQDGSA